MPTNPPESTVSGTALPDWSRIDTVLLDMDGTLLDLRFDNFFWRELVPARYAELNGLSPEQAREVLVPKFAARQGTLDWYCTDFWSREIGFSIAELKASVREHIRFLPGVPAFLGALRASGRRIVLLTNAHHDSLRIKAEHTGLESYLDVAVSSHSLGFPKEQASFWEALAAHRLFDRARALFVDDSLPVLEAARAHGIAQVFAVARPDSTLPPREIEGFPAVHCVAELWPGGVPRGIPEMSPNPVGRS